jgi:hypothetical protein
VSMGYPLTLVLALCISAPLAAQTAQNSRTTGLFEKYKTSVVKLHVTGKNPKGEPADVMNGTGFFITTDGYLITALHVVKKDSDWLQNPDGTVERTVKVNGIDANNRPVVYAENAALVTPSEALDIAVLKTNVIDARPVEFEASISEVYSAAYSLCWQPSSQMPDAPVGTINSSDSSRAGDLMRLSNMLLDPANSGAPVFDAEGAVIGVAVGINLNERNVALARSSPQIRRLLPEGANVRLSRADATAKVKVVIGALTPNRIEFSILNSTSDSNFEITSITTEKVANLDLCPECAAVRTPLTFVLRDSRKKEMSQGSVAAGVESERIYGALETTVLKPKEGLPFSLTVQRASSDGAVLRLVVMATELESGQRQVVEPNFLLYVPSQARAYASRPITEFGFADITKQPNYIQISTIRSASHFRDPEVIRALFELLKLDDTEISFEAKEALVDFSNEAVVEKFIHPRGNEFSALIDSIDAVIQQLRTMAISSTDATLKRRAEITLKDIDSNRAGLAKNLQFIKENPAVAQWYGPAGLSDSNGSRIRGQGGAHMRYGDLGGANEWVGRPSR